MTPDMSWSDEGESPLCWAGRKAFMEGAWNRPCDQIGRHVVTVFDEPHASPEIRLCDHHYAIAEAAGLVTEPEPLEERVTTYVKRRRSKLN